MLTAWKKSVFTVLLALLTVTCFAQDNVRLLNGSAFISTPAANAADGRLATELPNHDVRISYVTSFVGVQDRYKVYEDNDLMTFGQIPYTGGFVPATQAQKDAAVNAGIHHALTTVTASSESTIHIIYAISVSLDAQGDEVFSSRKFFHFGDEVDRRSEAIVLQIIPNPELLAAGVVGSNDTYLADYVEELINALNDPNYVINGSIEYNGEPYFDGDTIFYFHQADEIIETEVAGLQELKLLINQDYPVSPVNWVETEQISGAGTLLASNSGGNANIKIKADHFTGIAKFTGTYGSETTTVWYYPVNPVIDLGYYNDVANRVMESHEDISVQLYMHNNQEQFRIHPGILLKTEVITAYGSSSSEMVSIAADDYNVLDWSRLSDQCEYVDLKYSVIRKATGQAYTRKKRFKIKCPFEIAGIRAIPTDNDGVFKPQRTVESGTNDTLFIVSSNNDITRDIGFEIIWDGEVPEEEDFWDSAPSGEPSPQPRYYFGHGIDESYSITQPSLESRRQGPIQVEYDGRFFPGPGWINPDVGEADVSKFNAGVRAFSQHYSLPISFLRENRRVQEITLPNWLVGIEVFINQHFNSTFQKINNFVPPPLNLDVGVSISTAAEETIHQQEDKDSPLYIIDREKAIGATIGLNGNLTWDLSPGPWLTIGPFVDVGLSFTAAYEYEDIRRNNETEWTPLAHTLELPLTGSIALGAIIALNLHDADTTGINFVASASASFPIEWMTKFQKDIASGGTCLIIEATGGPAYLNFSVSLGAQFDWGGIDVDMNIFDYSWSYPITDKYFLPVVKKPITGNWDCN